MWTIILEQMRHSRGRLVAAVVAIAIATGLLTATMVSTTVIDQVSTDVLSSRYGHSDLIVTRYGIDKNVPANRYKNIASLGGIEDMHYVYDDVYVATDGPGEVERDNAGRPKLHTTVEVQPYTPNLEFAISKLIAGHYPRDLNEIALPQAIAQYLGKDVGDEIIYDFKDGQDQTLTISGITVPLRGAYEDIDGVAEVLGRDHPLLKYYEPRAVIMTISDDADASVVRMNLARMLPVEYSIQTRQESVQAIIGTISSQHDFLRWVSFALSIVAVVVASLVVSNIFQMVLHQRRRGYALLRCVGAKRNQIKKLVIREAGLLGTWSATLGILGGLGLTQLMLSILRSYYPRLPLPNLIPLSPWMFLLPLCLGISASIVSAWIPARRALQVSPLAALSADWEAPDYDARNRIRAILSITALGLGGALVYIALNNYQLYFSANAVLGVLGGVLILVATVLSFRHWVAALVKALIRWLPKRLSVIHLSLANIARNPRRSASSVSAFFIGMVLISMLVTAASSLSKSISNSYDSAHPYDMKISKEYLTMDTADGFGVVGIAVVPTEASDPTDPDILAALEASEITSGSTLTFELLAGSSAGGILLDANSNEIYRTSMPYLVTFQTSDVLQDLSSVSGVTGLATITKGQISFGDSADYSNFLHLNISGADPEQLSRVSNIPEVKTQLSDETALITPDAYYRMVTQLETAQPGTLPFELDDENRILTYHRSDGQDLKLKLIFYSDYENEFLVSLNTFQFFEPEASNTTILASLDTDEDMSELTGEIRTKTAGLGVSISNSYMNRITFQKTIDSVLMIVSGLVGVSILISFIGVSNTLSLAALERKNEIAMLRVLGLTRKQLRRSLLLEGSIVNLIGALVGAGAGVALGLAGATLIGRQFLIVQTSIPWLIVGTLLVGMVLVGMVAFMWPAWRASKRNHLGELSAEQI